jgi:DNA-binding winged helix-turn-helix (wHTH) protein/tetratricopeptide (TPR) repeat protein
MFKPAASYQFGPYRLDAAAYRLMHQGEPIPLSPKALDLLFLFASRPGALLTKDAILAELWPDVAVTDNALTQVVSEVRQALGDSPATPVYLETVPRRGYRFVATLERADDAPPAESTPAASTRAFAVVDFVNVTGDPEIAWLSAGIPETITNALRAIRELRIDRSPATAARAGTFGPGDMVVRGSFQRAGDQIRVTAEAVDAKAGETLAHAKADGPLADVFRVQDDIVAGLVRGLRLSLTPATEARLHARETASLEAYRALTEGRLKLEALDPTLVPAAIAAFERARDLDPSYALAYVGLAHALFWRFQASRATNTPDRESLVQAIGHARHAVDLDPELAEGHAALAFFLASADRPREAVAAGRVATALEPSNWRHQFRLGIAAWGDERLACLEAVGRVYPQMAFVHFGRAMVEVARGELDRARQTIDAGLAAEAKRPPDARFPGAGLHWLLGLIELSSGSRSAAESAFEREANRKGRDLFAAEFAMDAWSALGFSKLLADEPVAAVEMFGRALALFPGHARSLLGLAEAERRQRNRVGADQAMARARQAIEQLRAHDRTAEAALADACAHVLYGRSSAAILVLDELLMQAPPGQAGWTIPVEPFTTSLRQEPAFASVLARLASRAR